MNRAIIVKACRRFIARRAACEATWVAAIRNSGVPVWFVIGGQSRLTLTARDVLGVASGDSYRDTSIKLREALAAVLPRLPKDVAIFVCDDDTFVHPERWLGHNPDADLEGRLYRLCSASDKLRNGGRSWVHGGAGYWMRRQLCELYVASARRRQSSDDVLVSRIAQRAGLTVLDRPDLYGDDKYGACSGVVSDHNRLITCHPAAPDIIRLLFAANGGT